MATSCIKILSIIIIIITIIIITIIIIIIIFIIIITITVYTVFKTGTLFPGSLKAEQDINFARFTTHVLLPIFPEESWVPRKNPDTCRRRKFWVWEAKALFITFNVSLTWASTSIFLRIFKNVLFALL